MADHQLSSNSTWSLIIFFYGPIWPGLTKRVLSRVGVILLVQVTSKFTGKQKPKWGGLGKCMIYMLGLKPWKEQNDHELPVIWVSSFSTDCLAWIVLLSGWFFGDPHIATLDGFKYSFNGLGDYVMLTTPDKSHILHGKTVRPPYKDTNRLSNATVFSGFAMRNKMNTTVQVCLTMVSIAGWLRFAISLGTLKG